LSEKKKLELKSDGMSEEFRILASELCSLDKRMSKVESILDNLSKLQWVIFGFIAVSLLKNFFLIH
jgi:hypothetical protein